MIQRVSLPWTGVWQTKCWRCSCGAATKLAPAASNSSSVSSGDSVRQMIYNGLIKICKLDARETQSRAACRYIQRLKLGRERYIFLGLVCRGSRPVFFRVFSVSSAATRQIVPRDFIKVPSRQKVENAADHKSPIIK
jgi:hypothetical protein